MIGQRLRDLFSRSPGHGTGPAGAGEPPPPPSEDAKECVKRSHGLAQFVTSIRDESGLSILDLGEICQQNVTFITNLGHRLHSVDFLRTLDSLSTPDAPIGGPTQLDLMDSFLDQTLGYEPAELDGALIWDSLQYLSRPLLLNTVNRLYEVLRPGAYMLAFFQTSEKASWVPVYSYRIEDDQSLHLVWKTHRQPVHFFNNRGIERVFERFDSVKFFLTRGNLREVIVRR